MPMLQIKKALMKRGYCAVCLFILIAAFQCNSNTNVNSIEAEECADKGHDGIEHENINRSACSEKEVRTRTKIDEGDEIVLDRSASCGKYLP